MLRVGQVSSQNEKLSSSNRELRRRLRQSQTQLNCLVDERAELQVSHLLKGLCHEKEVRYILTKMSCPGSENENLSDFWT
jgi:hypothetical protein